MQAVAGMHTDKNLARAMALVMHAVFFALIVVGVSWQKKPPEPVSADLWASLPSLPQPTVAPPAQEVEDEPEPPKPVPRVKPVPLVPNVPKAEPKPVVKPDIALQKKAEPKRRDEEKAVETKRLAVAREHDMKRVLEEKEADSKAAAEKAAADKAASDKAAATRAAAARDNQRYINGIYAKVYGRIAVPPDLQGSPVAEFEVSLLPGGELENVTMRRSSGNAAYDGIIERAIRQSQPFVVPSGEEFQRSFRRFPMVFRPR